MTPDVNETIKPLRVADLDLQERPREKALKHGVSSLTDAELLAIILGSGTEGLSVIDLAKTMLAGCGNSVNRLASMTPGQLSARFRGIGPAKAITLLAALQLGMRCTTEVYRDDPRITSAADVNNLMAGTLRHLPHEECWVLLMTHANRVKDRRLISRGGIAATVVDIRVLMREAISAGASAIILVHNHPSGTSRPSGQDDTLTRRVAAAAATLDIAMLDHVIIAGSSYYSYRDEGKLN